MKTQTRHLFVALVLFSTLIFRPSTAFAQGTTAFTYQGQLRDGGTNANGAYTMIFKLYDAVSAGNQIGSGITNSPTLANGLFTVNLDFGAGAFNGSARWLEITVSNGVAQILSPRVQVLPAPYAQFAATAATVTNGAIMNAQLAVNAVNGNNIASGQVVKSLDGLADVVSLTAGTNVILTTNGNTLQISASGGGGGVTVTNKLAAGNNVGLFTNSGIVQISSFVPSLQFFRNVTNATFTVPSNVTKIMVEMWGAGGGGGIGSASFSGGGGGAGAYTLNIFTNLTPGSSFSVTVPSFAVGGQNGGTSSFSGNSISMTAGGGRAGANATAGGNGAGGAVGTATGGLFQAGDNGGQGGGFSGGGGYGGGVWRGSPGAYPGGGSAMSGPGGGGGGGGPNGAGSEGNSGLVLVYY